MAPQPDDNNERRGTFRNSERDTLELHGYNILNTLGSGSYGKVYVGEFRSSKSTVLLACKVIDTGNADDKYITKFLPRELSILMRINHPHIIRIHSIFANQSKYFIFMRFAEKGDLYMYLKKHGAVREDQARVWTRQLALALQYLHILDIAHRDIKSKNVLLTARLNVKLADFGFSRVLSNGNGKYVYSQTYCGTMQYLAPEVLQHNEYDAKCADMWSMGVLIYNILNNSLPFQHSKDKTLIRNQLQRKWHFNPMKETALSYHVKVVIRSLLEPNIEKRWTVDELVTCEWIQKDVRLRVMDKQEYNAFINATDYMKVQKENHDQTRRTQSFRLQQRTSPTNDELKFFKRGSLAFYLDSLRSEINFIRKRVLG